MVTAGLDARTLGKLAKAGRVWSGARSARIMKRLADSGPFSPPYLPGCCRRSASYREVVAPVKIAGSVQAMLVPGAAVDAGDHTALALQIVLHSVRVSLLFVCRRCCALLVAENRTEYIFLGRFDEVARSHDLEEPMPPRALRLIVTKPRCRRSRNRIQRCRQRRPSSRGDTPIHKHC